jgi:hypothetical protein
VTLLDIERLRALKAEGQYQDAFNLYLQLVTMREASAEACLIGGQSARKLGNLWAARDALESCLERGPDGETLGMAQFLLGVVMRQLGKPHEAILRLTAFLDGLPEYPQLAAIGLGPALYDRGIAFQYADRLEESLYAFSQACDEFRREGMSVYLCMALQNRAWVAGLFGDALQVRLALQEARPLCNTPVLQWHQRLGEAFLASIDYDHLNAESRRTCQRQALELCAVIYNHQDSDVPVEARSQSYWLAGTISLDIGEIEDAHRLGQEAMHYAFAAPVGSRCLYDAADLLRQVHTVRSEENRTRP